MTLRKTFTYCEKIQYIIKSDANRFSRLLYDYNHQANNLYLFIYCNVDCTLYSRVSLTQKFVPFISVCPVRKINSKNKWK